MSETIAKKQIDQLIEDASYMQDEAEALKYVIDQVPHDQQPPDGRSVAEILVFIDEVQSHYFRPSLEKAVKNPRSIRVESLDQFTDNMDESEDIGDIQSLLDHLAKHRAGIINIIRKMPAIDWSSDVYVNGHRITLFEFGRQMTHFDHNQLKKLAGLVRVFGDQKQTERQINKKRDMRNPSIGTTD